LLFGTGASMVALSREDAEWVGIDPSRLACSMTIMTATGRGRAAPVTLEPVAVVPIFRTNFAARVSDAGRIDPSILGLRF
ncbi:TIGR02281 family clan AA aspartic protease, partial [Rhizobium johnstonii]|uniref:TIGR02281 family clan AA aspartic protease n=1 Tax=Rhizobium johnstonii TaxID=3019933 RepID=UPI003F99FDD9